MLFATSKEQRDFFSKNGRIQLEGLLSKEAAESIPPQSFERGRDLWRADPAVKKVATHPSLARLAADCLVQKNLRLAYDQLLPAYQPPRFFAEDKSPYAAFLSRKASLNEISCVEGLAAAFLIALEDRPTPFHSEVLPARKGDALLLSPSLVIDWSELKEAAQRFYLIAYAFPCSQYKMEENDFHTHEWKHLGYIYGEALKDSLHPIVLR